jgi:hypothetical protein
MCVVVLQVVKDVSIKSLLVTHTSVSVVAAVCQSSCPVMPCLVSPQAAQWCEKEQFLSCARRMRGARGAAAAAAPPRINTSAR